VDFSLKPGGNKESSRRDCVSILVLVDFSLKQILDNLIQDGSAGFNPCFGGFFSKTLGR